jgi:5'-deoxynucleotidase YfbR-like HD superfamily hydrolase
MENSLRLLHQLIELQRKYAFEARGITTEERYNRLIKTRQIKKWNYDTEAIREPLIEHVGHLPIIASFLYPYIKNVEKVDLGRVLVMLSIHDFGETIVGDIFTFHKNKNDEDAEYDAVVKNLNPRLLPYFKEFEERKTMDSKFAKSVDSIAPLLHELSIPVVTKERFEHFGFDTKKIDAKKRKDFEWDPVLSEIFEAILKEYRSIEKQ